jgi:hypothetical protein
MFLPIGLNLVRRLLANAGYLEKLRFTGMIKVNPIGERFSGLQIEGPGAPTTHAPDPDS